MVLFDESINRKTRYEPGQSINPNPILKTVFHFLFLFFPVYINKVKTDKVIRLIRLPLIYLI